MKAGIIPGLLGMAVPPINLQKARNNSGKLCNHGADLLHSDLFSLFDQHCLHLGDCHNPLGGSAPLDSPLNDCPYAFNWLKSGVDTYSNFRLPYFLSFTACKMSTV